MMIQNITSQVGWGIHTEWLSWLQRECIPEIMATGLFVSYQLVKVWNVDDLDGPTYALQLYAENAEQIGVFNEVDAPRIASQSAGLWGDAIVNFTSLMEVVN